MGMDLLGCGHSLPPPLMPDPAPARHCSDGLRTRSPYTGRKAISRPIMTRCKRYRLVFLVRLHRCPAILWITFAVRLQRDVGCWWAHVANWESCHVPSSLVGVCRGIRRLFAGVHRPIAFVMSLVLRVAVLQNWTFSRILLHTRTATTSSPKNIPLEENLANQGGPDGSSLKNHHHLSCRMFRHAQRRREHSQSYFGACLRLRCLFKRRGICFILSDAKALLTWLLGTTTVKFARVPDRTLSFSPPVRWIDCLM
ncbi:hypothetical protein GGR53DRAFT_494537, partial [Hypoxylon sp. FL1150]